MKNEPVLAEWSDFSVAPVFTDTGPHAVSNKDGSILHYFAWKFEALLGAPCSFPLAAMRLPTVKQSCPAALLNNRLCAGLRLRIQRPGELWGF